MGWNVTAPPADATLAATGTRSGIFYVGEPLTFTLSGGQPASYDVRDYWGQVVASGTAAVPGTLTLRLLPPGWYRLYFHRAAADSTWGLSQGEHDFAVVRATAGFPTRPPDGTSGGLNNEGNDVVLRGLLLGGPTRHAIDNAQAPTTGGRTLSSAQADVTLERSVYLPYDAARPKEQFVQFPGGTRAAGSDAGVAQVVAACGPVWYECRNEPQGTDAAAFVAELSTFAGYVKAADPDAKVLGPNPVSINADTLPWLDAFLTAGGAAYLDGISWHDYNAINGDLATARTSYDALVAILTKHGVQDMPRWMTEWGTFAATYGSFTPRRQARWLGMSLLLWEQYGIPKERVNWFYDSAHGFWDFPSFWATGDNTWAGGSLYPAAVLMRVWSEEVYGKAHAERLTFGPVEDTLYVGSRFDGEDGSSVIALVADRRTDGRVIFTVTGATSLVRVDAMGATTTLAVTDGQVACPVTETPCYLRLPAGVTTTVAPAAYGPNLFRVNGTPLITGATATPALVNGDQVAVWAGPTTFPTVLTVALDAPLTLDTVIIRCPPVWQNSGTLLDYDLHWNDGSSWNLAETVTEPENSFPWVSAPAHGGCFTDTYFSERAVFVHELPVPVRATALRLTIRSTTKGGETSVVNTVGGNGQGATAAQVTIREIEVYNRRQQRVPAVVLAT